MFDVLKLAQKAFKIFTDKEMDEVSSKVISEAEAKIAVEKEITDRHQMTKSSSLIQSEFKSKDFLQRNWRPMIMMLFGTILLFTYIIFPIINFVMEAINGLYCYEEKCVYTQIIIPVIPDQLWNLLQIGIGGYIVGRSSEKIMTSYTTKR